MDLKPNTKKIKWSGLLLVAATTASGVVLLVHST